MNVNHSANRPITIGRKASTEQFGPRELVDLAVLAEEHGSDSVMVSSTGMSSLVAARLMPCSSHGPVVSTVLCAH